MGLVLPSAWAIRALDPPRAGSCAPLSSPESMLLPAPAYRISALCGLCSAQPETTPLISLSVHTLYSASSFRTLAPGGRDSILLTAICSYHIVHTVDAKNLLARRMNKWMKSGTSSLAHNLPSEYIPSSLLPHLFCLNDKLSYGRNSGLSPIGDTLDF